MGVPWPAAARRAPIFSNILTAQDIKLKGGWLRVVDDQAVRLGRRREGREGRKHLWRVEAVTRKFS